MKLSRLYSNQESLFGTIDFRPGLNVVLAEIRLPENKGRDTHNLGKSILARLVDHCLLKGRDPRFFLFKHEDLFKPLVFFLEIELHDQGFLTIRRATENASKISLKRHEVPKQDYRDADKAEWDHYEVAFERAKSLVDGIIDLRALDPWDFRDSLGYLLRSQDDYTDVFQLQKVQHSAHSDWKPYLSHVLGFDSTLLVRHYEVEDRLEQKEQAARALKAELGGPIEDLSKIEGLLLLKKAEVTKKQEMLDAFDFRANDREATKYLVEDINTTISELNSERYFLAQNQKKIRESLSESDLLFDPERAGEIFSEAGILFEGQVKVDFQQLIAFNKAITEERKAYLTEELGEIKARTNAINSELNKLGKERSQALSFLSETDEVQKYKGLSQELVGLKADIESLERQQSHIQRLQKLRAEIRDFEDQKEDLQTQIEKDVETKNEDRDSLFSAIRLFFSDVVEEVIGQKALLTVAPNRLGHLEFGAEILDTSGNQTSADAGHSYKKLLCIAFDMAILRGHLDQAFPQFVYHDGVFESLDDRKKEKLLSVIREYTDLGLQHIITLIDSDMPTSAVEGEVFDDSEIVLHLHDEGDEGRLFKMASW